MADSIPVVLLAGAMDLVGERIARAVLASGGKVAAAVPRTWQVSKLREQLGEPAIASGNLLVGVVAHRDSEAAAGFLKGAKDALGEVSHFVGASVELRMRSSGEEPAGDLEDLLDHNLHGNATLARAVLTNMRRRKHGSLAFAAAPNNLGALSANCRSSLAALNELAQAIADDVVAMGLRVRSIPVPADAISPSGEDQFLALWLAACDLGGAAS